MHPERTDVRAKSPLAAAILISLAIAAAAVLCSLDSPIFDEITSGRWLTRSLSEAQARNTMAIAKLEHDIGSATSDIDFIAARLAAAIDRNDTTTRDRLAEIDARVTAIKERIVAQAAQSPAPQTTDASDVVGLRKSLHELAAAQSGSVAEIDKRLNRIERLVGISTDVISSTDPVRRRARHSLLKDSTPRTDLAQGPGKAEPAGHIFDLRPVSLQTAPLRLSKLRD
jgi:hypothetical protein